MAHDHSKQFFVYILANGPGGTLYVGVTNDLIRRVAEHKKGTADSFTKKYDVTRLVYFEVTTDIESAITREKQLKHWNREWKINLIVKENREWKDLYDVICV